MGSITSYKRINCSDLPEVIALSSPGKVMSKFAQKIYSKSAEKSLTILTKRKINTIAPNFIILNLIIPPFAQSYWLNPFLMS